MAENDSIRNELNALRSDFAKLQSDITALAGTLKDAGAARAHDARESIEEELRRRRDYMRERLHEAKETGRRAAGRAEDEISDHPWTSVAAAFGVGFVLAKLMQIGGRN